MRKKKLIGLLLLAPLVFGCGFAVRMGGGQGFQVETVWGDAYVDQCDQYATVPAAEGGGTEVICAGNGRETRGGHLGETFKGMVTGIFDAVLKAAAAVGAGFAALDPGAGGA